MTFAQTSALFLHKYTFCTVLYQAKNSSSSKKKVFSRVGENFTSTHQVENRYERLIVLRMPHGYSRRDMRRNMRRNMPVNMQKEHRMEQARWDMRRNLHRRGSHHKRQNKHRNMQRKMWRNMHLTCNINAEEHTPGV
jgi:hypothetical protein